MTTAGSITDLGVRALAAFIHEQRPDFDAAGIAAALRADRDTSDGWQLALRMIHRAADPRNTTPRLQPFDAPALVGCRRHPGAAIRTNGDCAVCFAERYEAPERGEPVGRVPVEVPAWQEARARFRRPA